MTKLTKNFLLLEKEENKLLKSIIKDVQRDKRKLERKIKVVQSQLKDKDVELEVAKCKYDQLLLRVYFKEVVSNLENRFEIYV